MFLYTGPFARREIKRKKIVVLASEPLGGRSRATELPCFIFGIAHQHKLFPYYILTIYVSSTFPHIIIFMYNRAQTIYV